MKKIIIKLLPVLFIIGVWMVFSSPYFFKHLIPFPTTYQVNHFAPWSLYPENWGPVKNDAIPDVISQIYPWKYLTIQIEKSGHLPLWNPYNFSGTPLLANFQSAALSPFNVLFFLLSFPAAWSILILLQPLLAGFFMYLFVRELKIGKIGALISSVAFMFCGFIVVWMPYGTLGMAVAFLPLVLFAMHKSFQKPTFASLVLLALSICFSLFSGHFQTSLYVLLFAFLYFVFCLFTMPKKKNTLVVFIAFFAGLLLAMPQILPSIEFYFYAPRSSGFLEGGGISWYYFVTVFAPDIFGNPVTRNDFLGNYAEWASFVGIVPLLLASFATTVRNRRKETWFFTLCTVLFFVLAMASPLQTLIEFLRLPVLSTSNPSRIVVLLSFSLCVLAGFGAEKLADCIMKRDIRRVLLSLMSMWVVIIITFIALRFVHVDIAHIMTAKHNLIIPVMLLLVASIAMIAFVFLRLTKLIPFVLLFLLVLVCADSLRFAQKWMPFDPPNLLYKNISVISAAKQQIGNGKIYGNLGMEVVDYYGLPSIEGYDPLYNKTYGEFIAGAASGKITVPSRSVVLLDRRGKYTDRVLNLLGVSLFFEPKGDTGQSWAYPVWDKPQFQKTYEDAHFYLFKNSEALPTVKLFSSYHVTPGKKALDAFYTPDFDYKHILLVDQKPNPIPDNRASGSAKIVSNHPNHLTITVHTTGNQLLLFSQSYYPGWKAYVDGKQTPILKADYAFRAVSVPEGDHSIRFEYQPRSFIYGVLLAFIGLILLASCWFIQRKPKAYPV